MRKRKRGLKHGLVGRFVQDDWVPASPPRRQEMRWWHHEQGAKECDDVWAFPNSIYTKDFGNDTFRAGARIVEILRSQVQDHPTHPPLNLSKRPKSPTGYRAWPKCVLEIFDQIVSYGHELCVAPERMNSPAAESQKRHRSRILWTLLLPEVSRYCTSNW